MNEKKRGVGAKTKYFLVAIRSVFKRAGPRFVAQRGPEAAAGGAFFAFFSIFPLLLLLIAGGSVFLESEEARNQVLSTVLSLIPDASRELIRQNLLNVLESRGTVGLIGAVTLLWSATGAFTILTRNLSRAWTEKPVRNLFGVRLVAMGIVVGLFLLLALMFFVHAAVGLLSKTTLPFRLGFYMTTIMECSISYILYFMTFIVLTLIYRWVPHAGVRLLEAAGGALFAFILAELVTNAFGWYLDSGMAKHNLVYGSLGALVAFLFWMYLINNIILFGAHIASAIAQERGGSQMKREVNA